MPKVEIQAKVTQTIETTVTREVDVPKSVLDSEDPNAFFNWLYDNEANHGIWKKPEPNDVEEDDNSFELNEAYVTS
ncbi:hypothetical protein ACFYP4_02310 [Streptomyces sp. NPDC005551]|uniref:hypothetical protein n=1 Tax=Streptomyces sp. NPDC005551 TaxID=3364725 RepID=UPI00369A412C